MPNRKEIILREARTLRTSIFYHALRGKSTPKIKLFLKKFQREKERFIFLIGIKKFLCEAQKEIFGKINSRNNMILQIE